MSTYVGRCPTPRYLEDGTELRCRARSCPSCGLLWAGDTKVRIIANVEAYRGAVAMATITAPGKDVLGNSGAMRDWNNSAPERWSLMHQACRQAAIRATGTAPTMLAWCWQYQERGALHKHAILGMETATERASAHAYLLAMDTLRHKYGFGFVSDTRKSGKWRRIGLESIAQIRAGRYLARYLVKPGAGGEPELTETVTRADVPPLVVYVSRKLTSRTGITMRTLRLRRRAWALGFDTKTGELRSDVVHDQAQLADLGKVLAKLWGDGFQAGLFSPPTLVCS